MKKSVTLMLLIGCFVLLGACETRPNCEKQSVLVEQNKVEPSIIGEWESVIKNRKVQVKLKYTFEKDGTCSIGGKNLATQEENYIENIKWTRNQDKIYIYVEGEDVGILNILSLDENSMVLWPEGEPKKEITYLTRCK